MKAYSHTQPGYLIWAVDAISILCCVVWDVFRKTWFWSSLLVPVFVITHLLFYNLTIEIADGRLLWRFGVGLVRKSIALAEIESALPWKMTGLGGWGIHYTPKGWLYNVSGRLGVEIRLKNGKGLILGSDEPERLITAIQSAIEHQQG